MLGSVLLGRRGRAPPKLGVASPENATTTVRWLEKLQRFEQLARTRLSIWEGEITTLLADGSVYFCGIPGQLGSIEEEDAPWIADLGLDQKEIGEVTRGLRVLLTYDKEQEPPETAPVHLKAIARYFRKQKTLAANAAPGTLFSDLEVFMGLILTGKFESVDGELARRATGKVSLIKILGLYPSVVSVLNHYMETKATLEELGAAFREIEKTVTNRDVARMLTNKEEYAKADAFRKCYLYSTNKNYADVAVGSIRVAMSIAKTLSFEFTCYGASMERLEKTISAAEKVASIVGVVRDEGKFSSKALNTWGRRRGPKAVDGDVKKTGAPPQPSQASLRRERMEKRARAKAGDEKKEGPVVESEAMKALREESERLTREMLKISAPSSDSEDDTEEEDDSDSEKAKTAEEEKKRAADDAAAAAAALEKERIAREAIKAANDEMRAKLEKAKKDKEDRDAAKAAKKKKKTVDKEEKSKPADEKPDGLVTPKSKSRNPSPSPNFRTIYAHDVDDLKSLDWAGTPEEAEKAFRYIDLSALVPGTGVGLRWVKDGFELAEEKEATHKIIKRMTSDGSRLVLSEVSKKGTNKGKGKT